MPQTFEKGGITNNLAIAKVYWVLFMCQAVCQALCIDYLIKLPQQACELGFLFFPNKDEENKAKNLSAGKRCFLNSNSDLNSQCLGSIWILLETQEIETLRKLFQQPLEFMCFLFSALGLISYASQKSKMEVGKKGNLQLCFSLLLYFTAGNGFIIDGRTNTERQEKKQKQEWLKKINHQEINEQERRAEW